MNVRLEEQSAIHHDLLQVDRCLLSLCGPKIIESGVTHLGWKKFKGKTTFDLRELCYFIFSWLTLRSIVIFIKQYML